MGAKGLKALIVNRTAKLQDTMADPQAFKKQAKIFAKAVKEDMFSGYVLPPLGTAVLVAPLNAAGAFPSYNATNGVFDGWEKISGETLAETIKERGGRTTHMGCAQCIIHCSNEYVDTRGNYMTASLEYETIWSMGGMCGIDDLDAIATLDFLCDDIGVDSMNTGVAIAVGMDAGYKAFGDSQAAIEMLEEIGRATKIGKILGNGPAAVGKHFNHQRIPAVKNQSIAAYDPRAVQGMGVTYGTSPMGADHTAGNVIDKNLNSLGGSLDPLKADGQVAVSRAYQIEIAAFDCTGLCLFALSAAKSNEKAAEALLKMINARMETELSFDDLVNMGIRVLKAEREFNRKAGFTRQDDRLPNFFYEEPLPPHNTVFVVTDDEMDSVFDF
jgi:aldehyde:ferredoxin oxidoreductase